MPSTVHPCQSGGAAREPADIDIEQCPRCGGRLKIIAAIVDPPLIIQILTHLGLPARAPPRTPAKPFPLFQAA
jgi:hypothetical protein